jgi:hypothetical protein
MTMKSNNELTRRGFIAAAGCTALAPLIIAREAQAQEVLSQDDPTAVALGYYSDHTKVDTDKWSKKAGDSEGKQQCSTCSLFMAKEEGMGQCSIFPGKLVNANGWCSAWVGG